MALDVSKLKEHQKKLYDFIADVKKDVDVESGTPHKPKITKAEYDELIKSTGSIVNNALFAKLAGMSHASLLETWTRNKTFTTCNGFVGACANVMGVDKLKVLENAGGKAAPISLGQFEIATWLAAHGMSSAWIPNENGAKPQYGDVFRAAEYHMGLSLDFEDDKWNTIESGQGGPSSGFDMLKRKSQTWGARKILGWIDMETLLSETTPLPYWLGGWWEVMEAPATTSYYYFDEDGCVYYADRLPASTLFPPATKTVFGHFSIAKNKYQTVTIRWHTDDPDETFQVVTSMLTAQEKARNESRHAERDTFSGTSVHGKPLKGKRAPGPASTGLSYAQSHPNGGAGDSTAHGG